MAEDFKKLVKEKKVYIGAEETLKNLKLKKIKKVYLASNCAEEAKENIMKYASLAGAEVEELAMANGEFGTLCKKPFSISVLAVKK